jgi:hypothetical protein
MMMPITLIKNEIIGRIFIVTFRWNIGSREIQMSHVAKPVRDRFSF